jgi:hypothetical protein
MKIVCFTPLSLSVLLASLFAVGCGSADTAVSSADPLPKRVGDNLATDFENAAGDAQRAGADFEERKRELAKTAQDLAGLQEAGQDLAKTAGPRNEWVSLMKVIDEAITSVSGDPHKPLVVVERLSSERLDDLSVWFASLPKSVIARLSDEDRRMPPSGAGWLWSLECRVRAIDETQKEMILADLLERLRNPKLPKLRLSHPIVGGTEKSVITFVVRDI